MALGPLTPGINAKIKNEYRETTEDHGRPSQLPILDPEKHLLDGRDI